MVTARFVITGQDSLVNFSFDFNSLAGRLGTYLTSGGLRTTSVQVDTPTWISTAAIGALFTDNYPYRAVIDAVVTDGTWPDAAIATAASIAATQATGVMPESVTVVTVAGRATGEVTSSGPLASLDLGAVASKLTNATGDLLIGLPNLAKWLLVGTALVAVGVVIVALMHPKETAKVFA
jgi:hypothetical protein